MTENEAKLVIKRLVGISPSENIVRAINMATDALEEIQQHRVIGTVEECQGAREKQSIKKPYWRQEEGAEGYACPCCDMGVVDANGIRDTYCHSCGQHLDWSDTD